MIIPTDNEPDLEEIDQTVRKSLRFVPTEHVDQVLELCLIREQTEEKRAIPPVPLNAERPAVRQ